MCGSSLARVASRTDIATEPYLTSALNGLKNVLMDDERYIRLYSIKGGIARLIDRLAAEISAEVRLNSPVLKIGRTRAGRIASRCGASIERSPKSLTL